MPVAYEIRRCVSGSSANWPKEPAAVAMPSAVLRFSGGTVRPMTAKTMANEVPASAEADEQSASTCIEERRVDIRHPGKTSGVSSARGEHYPAGAPAVSGCARERAERPPDEVLIAIDKENTSRPQPYSSAHRPEVQPRSRRGRRTR